MLDMELLERHAQKSIGQVLGLGKSQVSNIKLGQRNFTCLEVLLLQQSEQDPLLSFFNWKADDRIFWQHLENLQELLKIKDEDFSNMFSLSVKQFRFARSNCRSLSWRECHYFEHRYKIHPALWFTQDIDLQCLAKNIQSPFKSNAYLPEQFEGGGSRMRSLANAIQFVRQTWGQECSSALTSSMQITPESLHFSEKSISIKIFSILHQKLRIFGAKDEHYISMGYNNKVNHKNRRLLAQKIPRDISGVGNTMKYYIDHLSSNIDTNKHYKTLKLTKNSISAISKPSENFINSFRPSHPFSEREIALYGIGHMKTMPTYFGYPEFDHVELVFDESTGEAHYTAYFS